jgi:hypothetical protein
MTDIRSILIFILLLPALTLAQTIHVEKEKVLYEGKMEIEGLAKQDAYNKARNMLLQYVNPNADSLKEKKDEQELTTSASLPLPSTYHKIKSIQYKVKLQARKDEIAYEISDIRLKVRERGKKTKTIPSEQLLKAVTENGKIGMEAERYLNELDMHLQKLIATLEADLRKG